MLMRMFAGAIPTNLSGDEKRKATALLEFLEPCFFDSPNWSDMTKDARHERFHHTFEIPIAEAVKQSQITLETGSFMIRELRYICSCRSFEKDADDVIKEHISNEQ